MCKLGYFVNTGMDRKEYRSRFAFFFLFMLLGLGTLNDIPKLIHDASPKLLPFAEAVWA